MPRYLLGVDFGTTSARALLVDPDTGDRRTTESQYRRGVLESPGEPAISRQDADDYLVCLRQLLEWAASQGEVLGIGIDATASTPVPVDRANLPLSRQFPNERDALAWLWKDHSAQDEAEEITAHFAARDPARLARVGSYYAEWFWAKVLRCARRSPAVFDAAATWLEQCDFLTANLTGEIVRGSCAAGHKALYWNGYPTDALSDLNPGLSKVVSGKAVPCSQTAGVLQSGWGLPPGLPVAVGGVDAHLGAVGAGVADGRMCMVLGTSACHMAVAPTSLGIASVPGISGIADDSVLPGMLGLEAGQAAFGDLLAWVSGQAGASQEALAHAAESVPVGSNGVLTVDFHAGNRCPYADAELSGAVFGQTLQTTHAETYRSAVEALAMGVRQIVQVLTGSGVPVNELVACGGVSQKSRFVLQAIADAVGKEVRVSGVDETCALGAAIFAGVACGVFENAEAGQAAVCRLQNAPVAPNPNNRATFDDLYEIWVDAQSRSAAEDGTIKRLQRFRR